MFNGISAWQWHLCIHLRANINDGAEVPDVEANEALQCRETKRGMLQVSISSVFLLFLMTIRRKEVTVFGIFMCLVARRKDVTIFGIFMGLVAWVSSIISTNYIYKIVFWHLDDTCRHSWLKTDTLWCGWAACTQTRKRRSTFP